ncbi:unnamed protein product [Discosporangium mesarthrocarpum]
MSMSTEWIESMKASSRRLLGQEPEEKTAMQEMEEAVCLLCPTMTWKQRIIGFAFCLTIGFILTFGSVFRILQLLTGNPIPFVVFYSLGNAVSICSSFFLSGPWSQVKKMFAPTRVAATVVYLSTLGLTLTVASLPVVPLRGVFLLVLVVVQFIAMVWYSLSYIPYARQWFATCWGQLASCD